jgi:hypothetical protein
MAGCGTKLVDPCAGMSGACLAIHIDPSSTVSEISSANLHVTADGIDQSAQLALQHGGTSQLPVAVAISFANLADATPVHVDITGILRGTPVGDGHVDVTVQPVGHTTAHVQLGAAPSDGDGGAPDLVSTDLSGYLPLTVSVAGSGTGTVSAPGLACAASTCTGLYAPSTTVTITATAASNATFAGWSGGGCSGTATTCTVTMDAATTVTATFDWLFVPSHVPASAYRTDAANLSGVTAIDTHALTINGAAPPAGITFAFANGIAVLSVAQWNIDKSVQVTGDAPLVVVASGAVVMASTAGINAAASSTTPGPGGNALCSMAGAGSNTSGATAAGGGGGNFGGGASASMGPAGSTYGVLITDFCGGARGGDGFNGNVTDVSCKGKGLGGAGGGAIQISSAVSITLHGSIDVGGGGGNGGCNHANPPPVLGSSSSDGGGGGSGGEIFLEAPIVTVDGTFSANGGGGGAPKPPSSTSMVNIASNGYDAQPGNVTAMGGVLTAGSQFGGDGAFSPDGVALTAATAPDSSNSGGGGGGVGRIWLRTRNGVPSTAGAVFSPAPTTDETL